MKATIVAVIAATVDVDGVELFGHRRVRSHHCHWLKRPDSAAAVGATAIAAAAAPATNIGVMRFSFVRSNARDINFDPLVLPPGIEGSDDPLLSPQSVVYAASYRVRARESNSAPAVNVDEVAM